MRRQIRVNMGHQLAGRQSKSYDTKQTEPDFQLTFFKLSWRIWEVWSQEITAFLTATLIWAHHTEPQGGDIILSWTLKFPSQETVSMRRSVKSIVDIRMCSRYSVARHNHQEVKQRAIRGVMLCCTIDNGSLSAGCWWNYHHLTILRTEDRHWPSSLAPPEQCRLQLSLVAATLELFPSGER